MAGVIKGFLVDVYNTKKSRVVEFEDTLENIYKLLDVSLIDVTERKIGDYVYDIVCDDEGLFRSDCLPSAYDSVLRPQLVGNLLFVNHDAEGDFASLSEEQIKNLNENLFTAIIADANDNMTNYQALKGVEYV